MPPTSPIHHSAAMGRLAHVQELLREDPALLNALHPGSTGGAGGDPSDWKGSTPLVLAARYNQAHVAAVLLHMPGVVLDARDARGMGFLHWAAKRHYHAVLALALGDPDHRDEESEDDDDSSNNSSGDDEVNPPPPPARPRLPPGWGYREPPSEVAAEARTLLASKDLVGYTPLMHCVDMSGPVVWEGLEPSLALILRAAHVPYLDVHQQSKYRGDTALHLVLGGRYPRMPALRRLLAVAGADPSRRNFAGKTPLAVAREKGESFFAAVRVLEAAVSEAERAGALARVRALMHAAAAAPPPTATQAAACCCCCSSSASSSSSFWSYGRSHASHLILRPGGTTGQRRTCDRGSSTVTITTTTTMTGAAADSENDDDDDDDNDVNDSSEPSTRHHHRRRRHRRRRIAGTADVEGQSEGDEGGEEKEKEKESEEDAEARRQGRRASVRGLRAQGQAAAAEDDEEGEEEGAKARLRAVAAFAVGGSVGASAAPQPTAADGTVSMASPEPSSSSSSAAASSIYLPPELFRELLDMLAPPWDPLRARPSYAETVAAAERARARSRAGAGAGACSGVKARAPPATPARRRCVWEGKEASSSSSWGVRRRRVLVRGSAEQGGGDRAMGAEVVAAVVATAAEQEETDD